MNLKTRSEALHGLIEKAASEMRSLGYEGAAPWRAMAWNAFDNIIGTQCPECAKSDLFRLRRMIDKRLADLAGGTPQ
ncbi:hypothetical protein [Rhizobium sp. Leaf386]|uniref:hypothetical protein n=1 Tax=Rhizobium sp. Leaf386 TaxID=1736359 RepID=UPI0007134BB2|nr:hypothetical protein [Rhizobium sp. Leaf386]KQT04142.1 hypothetical protein ASG50_18255 [Rhizobium sp. Leaf386]